MQGLLASASAKGREADGASPGGLPQRGQHRASLELNIEWGMGAFPETRPPAHPTGEQETVQATAPYRQSKGSGLAPRMSLQVPGVWDILMLHFHMVHRLGFSAKGAFK